MLFLLPRPLSLNSFQFNCDALLLFSFRTQRTNKKNYHPLADSCDESLSFLRERKFKCAPATFSITLRWETLCFFFAQASDPQLRCEKLDEKYKINMLHASSPSLSVFFIQACRSLDWGKQGMTRHRGWVRAKHKNFIKILESQSESKLLQRKKMNKVEIMHDDELCSNRTRWCTADVFYSILPLCTLPNMTTSPCTHTPTTSRMTSRKNIGKKNNNTANARAGWWEREIY